MEEPQADGSNGPGGYFGVQWKGTSSKADTLLFSIWDESDEERVIPLMTPNEEARNETEPESTEGQNELYSEVWKLFSQSSTDVPALMS